MGFPLLMASEGQNICLENVSISYLSQSPAVFAYEVKEDSTDHGCDTRPQGLFLEPWLVADTIIVCCC